GAAGGGGHPGGGRRGGRRGQQGGGTGHPGAAARGLLSASSSPLPRFGGEGKDRSIRERREADFREPVWADSENRASRSGAAPRAGGGACPWTVEQPLGR